MGSKQVVDQQAGFSGGLNSVTDPAFLGPDQARQLANFRLTNYGAALKRMGTQLTNTSAITTFDAQGVIYSDPPGVTGSVCSGVYWPFADQIYLFAAATNSTAVHAWMTTYGSFPRTWTDLGATTGQFRPVIFTDVTHSEAMYVAGDQTNKVTKILTDGTVSSLTTSTAACVGLTVYNDRLWGWGAVGFGNYLYYSQLSSTAGSTGGDSLGLLTAGGGTIIVRTFSASAIRACVPVNGSLLIFHDRGISVLTGWGQDDTQVQPQALNATIGMGDATPDGVCVGNETTTGDLAFFITPVGLYVTNGGFVRPVGTPEKPDPLGPLLIAGTITPGDCYLRFNLQYNEVWVQVTGIGIYVYSMILASWSGPFSGAYASGFRALWNVEDSTTGSNHLWRASFSGAGRTGVFVEECDRAATYKDSVTAAGTGGTAVTATLQLHRCFAGDRVFSKSWRWVNLLATLTSGATPPVMTCTANINSASNTQTLSGLTSVEQPYYISPGGVGPFLDVVVSDPGSTGTSSYALATIQGNFLGQR